MSFSIRRVGALMLQEFFLTKRTLELFFDIFFFPMMNVVLFGLITQFLGASSGSRNASFLILGILLWEVISINQYNVTVSSLWSVWSHNLTNLFIAPISVVEYLVAHVLASLIRTVTVIALLAIGCQIVFGFHLFGVGLLNLLLFGVNLSLFGWWIGIALLGLIFRYGTRIQSVSWGVIFLFQPLTASFFPVSVLPPFIQKIAYALPATYVFEAARQALGNPGVNWSYVAIAFGLNALYLTLSLLAFRHLFAGSKRSGQFARNDAG